MLIIKNGQILTMTGELISGGDILAEDGIVKAVGKKLQYSKKRTDEVIDASDCFVFPGFIDSHSHAGLINSGIGDCFSENNPITPLVDMRNSVHMDSEALALCKGSGITSVMVTPPEENVVGGKCVLIKTAKTDINKNGTVEKNSGQIQFAFYGKEPSIAASMIRKELHAAKAYMERKEAESAVFFASPALEAYIPLLKRESYARIIAHSIEELRLSINIIKQFSMKGIIVGLKSVDEIPDEMLSELKDNEVGVIIGPCITAASSNDGVNRGYSLMKKLFEAGICTSLCTNHPETNSQYIAMCAGLAVKEGVSMENALLSITVNGARNVAEASLGTIKQGNAADIAIFDSNPLEVLAKTLFTIIDGQVVYRGSE